MAASLFHNVMKSLILLLVLATSFGQVTTVLPQVVVAPLISEFSPVFANLTEKPGALPHLPVFFKCEGVTKVEITVTGTNMSQVTAPVENLSSMRTRNGWWSVFVPLDDVDPKVPISNISVTATFWTLHGTVTAKPVQ